MSTWSCKAGLVAAALLLGGCEGGPDTGLLSGLSIGAGTKNVALSQTQMANGAFTLVPPQGFCIDRRSLKQRFALMARCDTLGAPSAAGAAPLGIITISVTPTAPEQALPTAEETADAARLSRVSAAKSENRAVTFRAEGVPPVADLDVTHWRGTARIGPQLIGVALYGPDGGRAVSAEGREILNDLFRRTRDAS